MKRVVMRSCVVTKEKLPKSELLRVVRTPEGNAVVDTTGKLNGRGAYLKKDIDVINRAKKNKILERILGIEIPDSIYDELLDKIN